MGNRVKRESPHQSRSWITQAVGDISVRRLVRRDSENHDCDAAYEGEWIHKNAVILPRPSFPYNKPGRGLSHPLSCQCQWFLTQLVLLHVG